MTIYPINKIKIKEIYYCIDKSNNNNINSMFMLVTQKRVKKNKSLNNKSLKNKSLKNKSLNNKSLKNKSLNNKQNNILFIDLYIIQYKDIKKNKDKLDIKNNLILFKKKYVYKLKLVKKDILLNKL